MHRIDPIRSEILDTLDYPQHRLFRGKDALLAVELAHLLAQVLSHDGRLIL